MASLVGLVGLVLSAVALLLYVAQHLVFLFVWHRRASLRPGGASPFVTILKPLAGLDDELAENLESFARLDYPAFEIIFGVADPADAALLVARAFLERHPELCVRIVLTDPEAAANPKVAQLVAMAARARGEVLVVSDSNVRVGPDYLRAVTAALQVDGTGLVTTLVAGTGERTLGAALENLQLCAVVMPGLAALGAVSRRPYALGKSMAMTRDALDACGGFEAVGHVLAEDFVLGRRVEAAGYRVALALHVVENRNVACTFARTLERHARWAKLRRALDPAAFACEPLFAPVLVATVGFALAPSLPALAALFVAMGVQTAFATAALRALRGRGLCLRWLPLEVVRTYLLAFCWLRACLSRRVIWRNRPFVIGAHTAIQPARASAPGTYASTT
ncbi:MAG: glycosyltransferase [Myxococcales bacterium]|nr:glycosyltransferase [Myxococcales bacterium]